MQTRASTRFSALADLNEAERAALASLAGSRQPARRNGLIREEGDNGPIAYFLLEGWAATYQQLGQGPRQFLKVHIAGDVMGAPSLPLAQASESIIALTDVQFAPIDLARLSEVFTDHPRLAMLFFLTAQEERVILSDRLTSLGRRDARARLIGFFVHLEDRCGIAEDAKVSTYNLPLTQEQIGDVLGLTAVHVNRVMRDLHEKGMVRYQRSRIDIENIEDLRGLAGLPKRAVVRNLPWLPPSRKDHVLIPEWRA